MLLPISKLSSGFGCWAPDNLHSGSFCAISLVARGLVRCLVLCRAYAQFRVVHAVYRPVSDPYLFSSLPDQKKKSPLYVSCLPHDPMKSVSHGVPLESGLVDASRVHWLVDDFFYSSFNYYVRICCGSRQASSLRHPPPLPRADPRSPPWQC